MSGTGFSSIGVHMGEPTRFTCHTYPTKPDAGPILVIELPDLQVAISNCTRGAVGADDVRRACELLAVVTRFAAEVERLHTQNTSDQAGEQVGGGCAA